MTLPPGKVMSWLASRLVADDQRRPVIGRQRAKDEVGESLDRVVVAFEDAVPQPLSENPPFTRQEDFGIVWP